MRYIGLDVHYSSSTFCLLEENGQEVQCETVRRHWPQLLDRLRTVERPWTICFEATCGYGYLYRELSRMAARVQEEPLPTQAACLKRDLLVEEWTESRRRVWTRQENQRNRIKSRGSTSRFKGISYEKSRRKWCGEIRVGGKCLWSGRFTDEVEAA